MTQFTRVFINPRNRVSRRALASLERLHAIVARATSDRLDTPKNVGTAYPMAPSVDSAVTRSLWRVDVGRSHHSLYIVSYRMPDVTVLREQLGVSTSAINTCDYEPFLGNLSTHQEWQFCLRANPTESMPSGRHGVRGSRRGIVDRKKQVEWFLGKVKQYGFHIPINRLEVPEIRVRESRSIDFNRKGSVVTLASAVFDGYLAVDDPDALRNALIKGIGRGKGYGFGLLTLAPVPEGLRSDGSGIRDSHV